MTKVVYVGPEEEFETETADGQGTQTIAQGQIGEVGAETLQYLKNLHPSDFWFGDEPEPQLRRAGAENVELEDSVRQEMIEGGARPVGVTVEQAMEMRTPHSAKVEAGYEAKSDTEKAASSPLEGTPVPEAQQTEEEPAPSPRAATKSAKS